MQELCKESNIWKNSYFKDNERYKEILYSFLYAWNKHYEENEEIYNSKKYKKAILGAGLPTGSVIIENKKGESVEYPANVFFNKITGDPEQLYRKKKKKQLDDYYNWFLKKWIN